MATSTALSKIAPCPSACALCWALLKTFSNTRGTATTIVGRTIASSSCRCAMSVANASLMPHSVPTRAMILVSMCASGRNRRVTSSGSSTRPQRVDVLQHVRPQVAVGEGTALRAAGGAGRVHDRGQPIGADAGDAVVQLGVVDACAPAFELVEAALVDHERLPTGRRLDGDARRTSRASPASRATRRTASLSLRIHCSCSADEVS